MWHGLLYHKARASKYSVLPKAEMAHSWKSSPKDHSPYDSKNAYEEGIELDDEELDPERERLEVTEFRTGEIVARLEVRALIGNYVKNLPSKLAFLCQQS